ncbi:MAG: toprim domain-containing protein [Synergistaceae bacterium]|nr:toprim domain-containing protein [Synergistaceae bacterium]MBR0069807.1 toprim domain-containing protein [Synergistaceae bacterium]
MTFKEAIEYIKQHETCINYAREELNRPVSESTLRGVSLAPGEHHHDNAFQIYPQSNTWCDWTWHKGGDIIELARWGKHNGDRAAAIRELCERCNITIDHNAIEYTQSEYKKLQDYVLDCHKKLRPQDFDYNHKRRIYDSTIEELKIGYDPKTDRLVIPYTRNGEIVYYATRDRSGKPGAQKYKKAPLQNGENGLANIPWGLDTLYMKNDKVIHTCLGDFRVDEMIAMSEGMFDILSFWQEKYKCLSPISGYFNKKYMPMVISACKSVKLVVMSFDNDTSGMNFTKNMAMNFIMNDINFICVRLPDGVKDISDYYAAGGNLDELVTYAVNGKALFNDTIVKDPIAFQKFLKDFSADIDDKVQFRQFLAEYARYMDKYDLYDLCQSKEETFGKGYIAMCRQDAMRGPSEKVLSDEILDRVTLQYIPNDGFYEYKHGVWERTDDLFIKGYVTKRLGNFMNNSRAGAVTNLLKSVCARNVELNKKNILNLQNGTLNLDTLELMPHSTEDLSSIQLTFNYDPKADCVKWKKFVSQVMSKKKRKIQLIQEICGYVLYPDCSLQKCFMLYGKGSNGKSVFLSVLRAVFGRRNCRAIELSSLAKPFYAIQLKDALLNACTEIDSDFKKDSSMFKKIVSGEAVYDSYKGKDGIEFTPRVKNFFACNSFVNCNHIDYGVLRRMLFVKFNERFDGKDANSHLLNELLEELPGILNWIIEGYRRLKARGAFIETAENKKTLNDFLYSVSPVDAFIHDELTRDDSMGPYSIKELYFI